MFLKQGSEDNFKLVSLFVIFVVTFAVFMALVVFMLFKIVYKKLDEKYNEQIVNKMMTSFQPISDILPPSLNNRLEKQFQAQRGTIPKRAIDKLEHKSIVRFV